MIEVDVFEILADEICGQCSYRQHIMSSCYDECPFQKHFAELRAKCEDIYRDADYLAELVAEDDSVEYEDYRTEEERHLWSHFAMKGFY